MAPLNHPRYLPGPALGQGSQALVLRVTDREAPGRALVAKVWQPGVFDADLLAGEFALLSRLHLPGLVRAHDLGRDATSGAPFLVEDYVDGPDARAFVAAAVSERARAERASRVLAEVTATLALLHENGFLHGDLKPAHVRVTDRAMLLDLGAAVARARAERGPAAITRGYAAPELLAGAAPSPRTDLYALGMLAFAVVSGEAPADAPVRARAAWLPPSVGDVIDRLRARHPEDRPASAREAFELLGQSLSFAGPRVVRSARAAGSARSPRERELGELAGAGPGVRYLTGPAGIGKSHVLGELVTRALLAGKAARLLRFPLEEPAPLIAWLRGGARPFEPGPLLLALDELHAAPPELRGAVEAYRCRPRDPDDVVVIAASREPPRDAPASALSELDEEGVRSLCWELGADPSRAQELRVASAGNPGFVAALVGKAPMERAAILARAQKLSPPAACALGALAVLGGCADERIVEKLVSSRHAVAELSAAGLLRRSMTRAGAVLALSVPEIAQELADALASFDLVDGLASLLLASEPRVPAEHLLALARASSPPTRRAELLLRAATLAREAGLRSIEIDALLALAADPKQRSREVLAALDRATRGGGSAGLHPELVTWLEQAAVTDRSLEVLALRRRAEQKARGGEPDTARALSERAVEHAASPVDKALALSTLASTALYRADWNAAEQALDAATAELSSTSLDDAEEAARLDHNRGVVALYRGRQDEARVAFERSLAAKRAMGDRGGTWACLLNLGLALGQLGRYAEAEAALVEGVATCRALGQLSGAGWCLAALADVCVRRGDVLAAERAIAEAEHLGDLVPRPVHADLALLRAELCLLDGDGGRALAHVERVDAGDDALLATRSLTLKARGHLCALPADRRLAARTALAAARRARAAGLPEPEARALSVLREARRVASVASRGYASGEHMPADTQLWSFLATLAGCEAREPAALALCRWVVEASGAERAFVLSLDARGGAGEGFGADIDGMSIGDARERVPPEVRESALRAGGVAHHPTVETRGGRGSRLTALGPATPSGARALLVLEHRFVPNAFESLDRDSVERWAICAGLAVTARADAGVAASVEPREPSLPRSPAEPSTVLPGRGRRHAFPTIAGSSSSIERALARLDAAVDSDLPVLVTGETGVGKELFARALHDQGSRRAAPFVAINCGAVPDSLFEAELFGHARGSFTGAERARAGLLARAEGGTLFLDEIGELPLLRQATLLRVLAEKRYRPVGSDEDKPFDVRIIAATNRNLEREVELGSFRRDLLYRLNVLEVRVPPLRERPEDVLPIAERVLAAAGAECVITPRAARALEAHRWPGNVRELEHQLQRVAASGVPRIELEHLSREVRAAFKEAPPARLAVAKKVQGPDAERQEVQQALSAEQGNITRTAERLRLTRQGLKKKMVRLGLREPKG